MISRIRKIADYYYHGSEYALAKDSGIPNNTLSQQLTGKRKLSLENICKILNAAKQVSPDWLLFGTGAMERGSNDSILIDTIRTLTDTINEKNKTIDALKREIEELKR